MNGINGTLREDHYVFLKIYRSVFLRKRNVSDKSCKKSQHILCSITFFSINLALYNMKWKNIVERCGPPMTIWRRRIACWIPKATKTHSEHVILIAFPQQQWLHEHASTLRYRVLLGFTAVTTRTVILFVTSSRYLKTFTEKYILHLQGEIHISTITSAICYFNKLRQCTSVIPAVGSQ